MVTDADDLGDTVESVVEIRHDLRLEFDRPGFPGHMRGARLGDQPVIAAIDPGIEAVLANEREGLAGNVGFHRLLFDDRQVSPDEQPAVEAGNRRIQAERVEQRGHAARRPTAGDGEADAGAVQRLNGGLRALRQNLLFGHERAVNIRSHQGDLASFAHLRLRVFGQARGRQARPSRASSSSAAAGPLLPAA